MCLGSDEWMRIKLGKLSSRFGSLQSELRKAGHHIGSGWTLRRMPSSKFCPCRICSHCPDLYLLVTMLALLVGRATFLMLMST